MPEISPYRRLQKNVALAPLSPDLIKPEIERYRERADRSISRIVLVRSMLVVGLIFHLQIQLFSLGAVSNWIFPFLGGYLAAQVALWWHSQKSLPLAHWFLLLTDVILVLALRFVEEVYVIGTPDVTVAGIVLIFITTYSLRVSPTFSKWSGIAMTTLIIAGVSQGDYASGLVGTGIVIVVASWGYLHHAIVKEIQRRAVLRSLRFVDRAQLAIARQLNQIDS